MIIREIKKDPETVLDNFDWFNDYDDTRRWCLRNFPEIVGILDEKHGEWLARRKHPYDGMNPLDKFPHPFVEMAKEQAKKKRSERVERLKSMRLKVLENSISITTTIGNKIQLEEEYYKLLLEFNEKRICELLGVPQEYMKSKKVT